MGKITETFAKRVQPPASGNVVHYDGEIDGFGLRVTAAGQKSFILNYRIFGKERRYTIGKFPDDYRVEPARQKAIELRQGIKEGRDPFAEKERMAHEAAEADARSRTVKQLAEAFLERHIGPYRRQRTRQEYKSLIDAHILPRLGSMRVTEVTQRDVSDLHSSLKATPYLANRARAVFSAMFNWARRDDQQHWGVSDNPAIGVEKFHEDQRERWLTEEEMQQLITALDEYPEKHIAEMDCSEKQRKHHKSEAERMCNALRLLMLTGARKGEVLSATWDQFDLERGVWTKPSHATKQKKTEHVPLSEDALVLLASLPRGGNLLFRGRRHGQQLTDINNAWAEICTLAGIDNLRIHDLRHNFASHLVSNGETLATVGRLLGHTQPQTTSRYAHFADNPLRKAANKFGQILKASAEPNKRRS